MKRVVKPEMNRQFAESLEVAMLASPTYGLIAPKVLGQVLDMTPLKAKSMVHELSVRGYCERCGNGQYRFHRLRWGALMRDCGYPDYFKGIRKRGL